MAEAWSDPQAWTGTTKLAGIELPAEAAGIFGLDELVVHGWDVAHASRQPYDCDGASLEALMSLSALDSPMGQMARSNGIFGPPVEVSDASPLLDRVIALTGRPRLGRPKLGQALKRVDPGQSRAGLLDRRRHVRRLDGVHHCPDPALHPVSAP